MQNVCVCVCVCVRARIPSSENETPQALLLISQLLREMEGKNVKKKKKRCVKLIMQCLEAYVTLSLADTDQQLFIKMKLLH